MKFINHKTKTFLSVVLLTGTLFSCSEDTMDSINADHDNPHNVDAKFILTDAITATAYSNIGGDFNHYFSSYVENEVGIFNQLFNAETRKADIYSSTTFSNVWNNLYSTLKNARIVVSKCSDEGTQPGNYATKGMGEILAAINAGLITDAFGDAPFSQAALAELNNGKPQFMNPELDKQEDIYKDIIKYLDDAIVDLPKGDNHGSGSPTVNDLLYKGDTSKWLKLAYGLKARYTMHLLNVTSDKQAALKEIVDYCNKSFTNTDEEAAFNVYDGNTNVNPGYDFFTSREYLAASESLSQKLIERNDPRMHRAFVTALGADEDISGDCRQITGQEDKLFFMAPNGAPEQRQEHYNTSIFGMASTASTFLMSYHEVLFLKVEALVRLERKDEAKETLKKAVIAGLLNMEKSIKAALNDPLVSVVSNGTDPITSEMAGEYFDTTIAPLFDQNPLKETMLQKYFAFWGANGESTECYNDVRRLRSEGNDFYSFNNIGKFPLRCPYGNDDVTSNPNVKAAYGNGQYVLTDNVWWAK